jgi:hypothetical protein
MVEWTANRRFENNFCLHHKGTESLVTRISCFLHVVVEAFCLLGCYAAYVGNFVHEHQHTYATYHLRSANVSRVYYICKVLERVRGHHERH